MIGETISHYRVLDELGGGAMGVVYKAQDTRLKRLVALKFLPPDMTRDEAARQRFVQEAEAASALDHPHVCTIHDIETTSDGRVFIAMAFYEGETLKKRLQRGPLPIDDVVSIGLQIAEGLAAAHEAGIVHRDIKPANVMITTRGEVKIVDFGIAKLSGQLDLTGTGLSVGTVAYMAPEQFEGQVDARADLWALGVVIYEMLTGRRPFEADTEVGLLNAIVNHTPTPVAKLRGEIPPALAAIVDRALQKRPSDRYASAAELRHDLAALRVPAAGTQQPSTDTGTIVRALKRPTIAVPLVAVVGVIAYVLASTLIEQGRDRWAREEAIPQIAGLLQRDEYDAAHALAQQAERYVPNDPVLTALWPQITGAPALASTPAGARVSVKPYASPGAEWRPIGTTPLRNVTLPRGAYRWRVEADGFEPVEFARNVGDLVAPQTIALVESGKAPPGMVAVPASRAPVRLTGFATEDTVSLEAFFIDRHEVTNRQFKAFVDAGGYAKPEYWKHEIVQSGRVLPWTEAMKLFHDSSGRPGPASWELGDYPDGQADLPVTGVSWYEAAAYAEFRGAHLPTLYHWARASLAWTNAAPIAGLIVASSNFGGAGPVAVGSTGAMGPYGTYDTAGNVREWCANASGDTHWVLGGAWNDHAYMYVVPYSLPPIDRSLINGIRLVQYADKERVEELSAPIRVFRRDFRGAKPVSDEVFEVFKRQFAYVPSPPNPKVEETDEKSPDWIRQKVSIDTGYGERLVAYVFVPKAGKPPYQTAVVFPGLSPFLSQSSSQNMTPLFSDFVVKSGRIVVFPVFKGSYERFDGFVTLTGDRYLQTFRQRMHQWRQEMGQLLDYLATRSDVQSDRLAYIGFSFGASTTLPVLAMEPRFKVAVLQLAGFSYRDLLPEVEAVNYVPRVTIPVLMLEGRYDHLFPVEQSQQPLLALLGSPADHKRQVHFDAGHGPLPRGQVIRETLTWLDRFLGPPGQ